MQYFFECTLPSFFLSFFTENVSDQRGERLHRYIASMENKYKEKWNPAMLANFCQNLKQKEEDYTKI